MKAPAPKRVTFAVEGGGKVSGLLQAPKETRACYVLAHGAGVATPVDRSGSVPTTHTLSSAIHLSWRDSRVL